jgi:8-amino-7-oxononanoate synthase
VSFEQQLQQALEERRASQLYRQRDVVDTACGIHPVLEGKQFLAFCSNDYLGLANHPKVIEAFCEAAATYGVGSGASHLISGHSREHHALEEELAEFTGRERALLFSTGYMTNLGIASALLGKGDYVFEDRLNHASLLDAGLISGARFKRYRHNDVAHLEQCIHKADVQNARCLVMTDGVFSMDGDIAPLPELATLCEKNNAVLMIDDAHGFGVLGETGVGCAELYSLDQKQVPVLMATLGKALGTFGAFVAGSEALIETLIQFARTYIYTTALPPAVAAATRCSLKLLQEESFRRQQLRENIDYFVNCARQTGVELMPSDTAVQPVLVGESADVLRAGEKLRAQGLLVGAIRPPTVPADQARLRITLSAEHSREDIDRLVNALQGLNDV